MKNFSRILDLNIAMLVGGKEISNMKSEQKWAVGIKRLTTPDLVYNYLIMIILLLTYY